jgi:hypothetical protein
MLDRPILFDSSVLINVLACNQHREILRVLPAGSGVCAAVETEALFLRGEEPGDPPQPIVLAALTSEGLLKQYEPENDMELTLHVELAADLDDGEATTLAIAHQRGMAIAIDDRKARRLASERFGVTPAMPRTSDVMRCWLDAAQPPEAVFRAALRRMETMARFRPPNDDPLREWWMAWVL